MEELLKYCERLERTVMGYCNDLDNFKSVLKHCFPVYYTDQMELDESIRLKLMWNKKRKPFRVADTVKNQNVMNTYSKNLEMQLAAYESTLDNFIKKIKMCQKYDETLSEFREISLNDPAEVRKKHHDHNRKVILGELGSSFRYEHYTELYTLVQNGLCA